MQTFKPAHVAITRYFRALDAYAKQGVRHEGALRTAFQDLLADTALSVGWQLIPELTDRIKHIRPDGTLRDSYFIERGHWEAKDSDDNLETEIKKKIRSDYPLKNIIFEDTQRAVLYQNGKRIGDYSLGDRTALASLLNAFYGHIEPAHETFEKAIEEFKDRVPALAKNLLSRIRSARHNDPPFAEAFEVFLRLCRTSLNPNLQVQAVEEMLVQHLLTERLIRKIFDNPDFNNRNIIAAEVERVIRVFVSRAFNRDDFLKALDPFYFAIESAAQTIKTFTEKQQFLNIVYERFFQGFSVKTADTHGIVYTPQSIVDFMCESIEIVLAEDFSTSLGNSVVRILDPCTGTGNFIVNLLNRLPKHQLVQAYRHQFFANEVLLMPYYIAALNIEHAFFESVGRYEPFEGLCFVDTLDMAKTLLAMTEANTSRVDRENDAPITVVVGNPPYNTQQVSENDNNKNRKYRYLDDRIRATYSDASEASLRSKLYEPYVRFFRWATDRLEDRDGIVCFISNNSFVEERAFDGMRRHLADAFSRIYHLDLHGDVRRDPDKSGTAYNVFGIRVGVGITIAIRHRRHTDTRIFYAAASADARRSEKLKWLAESESVRGIDWREIHPDGRHAWITAPKADVFSTLVPLGSKSAREMKGPTASLKPDVAQRLFSLGVSTNRDDTAYAFSEDLLLRKVARFEEAYSAHVDRWRRLKRKPNVHDWVDVSHVKWSSTLKSHLQRSSTFEVNGAKVRVSLYRPFTKRSIYYDRVVVDRPGRFDVIFPEREAGFENRVLCVPTPGGRGGWMTLMTNVIPDLHLSSIDAFQCFPLYAYDSTGNRQVNIFEWWLSAVRERAGARVTAEDVFYYHYGVLHHPKYRQTFGKALQHELPRLPLPVGKGEFDGFCEAGYRLAEFHVHYDRVDPFPLKWVETPGEPLTLRVERMKLNNDRSSLVVNDYLTLDGIPREVFEYRLGNRSALDWVIHQYRVKRDEAGEIVDDPNRPEDDEYIVKLVGRVISVSLETMKEVRQLPDLDL